MVEAQVQQMFREWKAKLNETSPASSLKARTNLSLFREGGSCISSDLYKLLLGEEKDDATSALVVPKPDPDAQKHDVNAAQEHDIASFQEGFNATLVLQEQGYQLIDQCKSMP